MVRFLVCTSTMNGNVYVLYYLCYGGKICVLHSAATAVNPQ